MKDENRLIFRAEAIRHYMQGRDKSVLPRFTSPRVAIFLWVFAVLMLAGGLLAWLVQVPVYASGVGIVVDSTPQAQEEAARTQLAVFLPDKELSKLHVGQRLFWSFSRTGERVSRSLVAVEPEVNSPAVVQKRFNLTGAAASVITKPVAVAFVNLDTLPRSLPASAYVGSVYRVDVEVGKMRVISLFPFIGRFFGE
jgi:hypothetical protein